MAKLKVITPKKVKRAKRAQTIRLAIIALIFIIIASSALIYIGSELQHRQAVQAVLTERAR